LESLKERLEFAEEPSEAAGVATPTTTKPAGRARQNVVFELGFFFGSVGRERVAVLYEPDVEKPSDIDGLV
jgi:predicted nucleotide-binding protein